MHSGLRTSSITFLLITGVPALVGGVWLIIDPTGSGLAAVRVDRILFPGYFVQGLILIITIGASSIITAILTILRHRYSINLIILQGWISMIWVGVQVAFLEVADPIHLVFGVIGCLTFGFGMMISEEGQERQLDKPVKNRSGRKGLSEKISSHHLQ